MQAAVVFRWQTFCRAARHSHLSQPPRRKFLEIRQPSFPTGSTPCRNRSQQFFSPFAVSSAKPQLWGHFGVGDRSASGKQNCSNVACCSSGISLDRSTTTSTATTPITPANPACRAGLCSSMATSMASSTLAKSSPPWMLTNSDSKLLLTAHIHLQPTCLRHKNSPCGHSDQLGRHRSSCRLYQLPTAQRRKPHGREFRGPRECRYGSWFCLERLQW